VSTGPSYRARVPSRVPPVLGKLVIVLGAFALGVGVAELVGAKNLGTALGVGQLTFVVALIYVLMRRERRPEGAGHSGPRSTRQDQTEQ
jgi:hypothetical protein